MKLPQNLRKEYTLSDLHIFDELFDCTKQIVDYLCDKYSSEEAIVIVQQQFERFDSTIYNDYASKASIEIGDGEIDPISQSLQDLLHVCFIELDKITFALYSFIDSKKLGRELAQIISVTEII